MQYWKCIVCGYIHEGSEPPEKCPVCGAPKEKFVRLPEAVGKTDFDAYVAKMGPRLGQILAKAKAEAEVAGVLAEAKQKAQDKARAEAELIKSAAAAGAAVDAENIPAPAAAPGPAPAPAPPVAPATPSYTGPGALLKFLARHHAHCLMTHVPNGVIPMVMGFMFLSSGMTFLRLTTWNMDVELRQAAFLALLYVLLGMPIVLVGGYAEWQVRYGGARTRPIITKIVCGVCVTLIAAVLVAWGLLEHNPFTVPTPSNMESFTTFVLLHLLMLSFAIYAGYLGGKLVFKND